MAKVTLIAYTQMNPEIVTHYSDNVSPIEHNICVGANLSVSKRPIEAILERFDDEENVIDLFEKSIGRGHWSVAEHSVFSFLIEDISLPCGEQILRHRTGSYTKQSYRYQKATMEAVIPPTIKRNKEALEKFLASTQQAYETYKELVDMGIPREDARYVIPTGTKCRLYMTIDARNLIHFLKERMCCYAQWEIRSVANRMYKILKRVAPNLAKYAGPRCKLEGTCTLPYLQEKQAKSQS